MTCAQADYYNSQPLVTLDSMKKRPKAGEAEGRI